MAHSANLIIQYFANEHEYEKYLWIKFEPRVVTHIRISAKNKLWMWQHYPDCRYLMSDDIKVVMSKWPIELSANQYNTCLMSDNMEIVRFGFEKGAILNNDYIWANYPIFDIFFYFI
jgi:hypothetical protein